MRDVLEKIVPLANGRLVPFEAKHTPQIVQWRNDRSIAKWFLTKHVFTVEGHLAWLARAQASGVDYNWVIEDESQQPIGAIGLYNIDWDARRAEIGRILIGAQEARGKGYARQALSALLRVAQEAGLTAIFLVVVEENVAAIALYKSIGFEIVGPQSAEITMEVALVGNAAGAGGGKA